MNRHELEVYAHRQYGHYISWMANVLNNSHRNPTTRIKGLLFLAFHNRVATCSGTMDLILINGSAVGWENLEQFAPLYNENTDRMRCHISMVEPKTAYTIAEAKLVLDPCHNAIQEGAQALVAIDNPVDRYGFYEYSGSTSAGISIWRDPEDNKTVTYSPITQTFS